MGRLLAVRGGPRRGRVRRRAGLPAGARGGAAGGGGLMAHVLFVCLHNAGRSQMSQALFERAADRSHEARSAGTTPGDRVHPEVVEAMRELGGDVSGRLLGVLTNDMARRT